MDRRSQETEKSRPRSTTGTSQLSLQDAVVRHAPYDNESQKHKLITKKLAIFVGATNIPLTFQNIDSYCLN